MEGSPIDFEGEGDSEMDQDIPMPEINDEDQREIIYPRPSQNVLKNPKWRLKGLTVLYWRDATKHEKVETAAWLLKKHYGTDLRSGMRRAMILYFVVSLDLVDEERAWDRNNIEDLFVVIMDKKFPKQIPSNAL